MSLWSSWQIWAVLSALFAALTAIFAKIGIENINSDFATFIRTIVILVTLAFILLATGQFQSPGTISGRTYFFLLLSGLATGASWICYFRALKIGQAAQVFDCFFVEDGSGVMPLLEKQSGGAEEPST